MKLLIIISILFSFQSSTMLKAQVNADSTGIQIKAKKSDSIPYGYLHKFNSWYTNHEFEKYLTTIPENKYPIVIEGGALDGDGVIYRVLVTDKPSVSFRYKTMYHAKEKKFLKMNKELLKEGFTLIQHQTVQLMAFKSHQAVWVKSK